MTGAIADNKVYNKLNNAIISGYTLVGVVGADDITVSNTGTFASVDVAKGSTSRGVCVFQIMVDLLRLLVSLAIPSPCGCFGVGSPMKNSVTPLLPSLGRGVM